MNPPTKQSKKETFGSKSTRTPPDIEKMKVFETKMIWVIENIEFSKYTNDFQRKLKKDIKSATENTNLTVKADKTTNYYQMKPTDYQSLIDKNVQKAYKK